MRMKGHGNSSFLFSEHSAAVPFFAARMDQHMKVLPSDGHVFLLPS